MTISKTSELELQMENFLKIKYIHYLADGKDGKDGNIFFDLQDCISGKVIFVERFTPHP